MLMLILVLGLQWICANVCRDVTTLVAKNVITVCRYCTPTMFKLVNRLKTLFGVLSTVVVTVYILFSLGPNTHMWRRAVESKDEQLLTAQEMQYMLHNGQVENTGDEIIIMDATRISNWRHLSDIRSRLTRPDPLKPIRLVGNYSNQTIEEFSEVLYVRE